MIATPLINIESNAIVSANGLVGLSYVVVNPQPYSLSFKSIEKNILEQIKALNLLGENIYYHRIDAFLEDRIKGNDYFFYDNFITKSENKYFNKREKYTNYTIVTFLLEGVESLQEKYLQNPFSVKRNILNKDEQRVKNFETGVKNAVSIFNNLQNTTVFPIEEEELKIFLFNLINGFNLDNTIHTSNYQEYNKIGKNYFKIFSFSSPNHFSENHTIIENDNTLPKNDNIFRNIFDELGIHFHFNHLNNQIIKIPNQKNTKEILEIRKSTFKGWANYKNDIENGFKTLKEFENIVNKEDNKVCYAHNNIILFSDDKEKLDKATQKINEVFSSKGLFPFEANYEYAENIYNACIIGKENELKDDFYYLSSLKDALPIAPIYGSFQNDKDGFIFQERVFRSPIVFDVLDKQRKHIGAKNGMFITSTGEGKSSSLLNICMQLVLNDVKLVCVEFGQSFAFLVRFFKKRAVQIKLRPNEPLGINPFNLLGIKLDSSKITSITGFVLKLMRKNLLLIQNESTYFVTLQKIIKNYYDNNKTEHTLENFYYYVLENWEDIKKIESLKDKFFDIDEFELLLSQFVSGGLYDFVCIDRDNYTQQILDADLVVFELTEIKKDPFLLSIVLTSLEDTINTNILSDRNRLGGVIFEEFGETSELKDIFGGGDVLSAVAWLYQKIRKENGFIWTILQNIKQLPNNQYTENIISNVQLLFTLGLTEKVADDIVEAFKIRNEEHINLMKSAKKQFDEFPKWSELFVRQGESRAIVVRQEFTIEKFLAFQTDGDIWSFMNKDLEKTNDLELTINNTIKHFNYEIPYYPNSPFLS